MRTWDDAMGWQIQELHQRISEDFCKHDLNKDGVLSYSEFGEMLKSLSPAR